MKIEATIKPHVVQVSSENEFCIFSRHPEIYTQQDQLTLSTTITPQMADRLDKSGIVSVESYKASGIMTYRRKNFYSTEKFIEVIGDLLTFIEYEKLQTVPAD